MPVRQATRTAVQDRAADKPKKPKREGAKRKEMPPVAPTPSLLENPPLVQALLEFTDLGPPPSPEHLFTATLTAPPPETLSIQAHPLSVPHAGTQPAIQSPSPLNNGIAPDESVQETPTMSAPGVAQDENAVKRENGAGAKAGGIDYHHDSEAEFGRLLGYYGIEWQYEPHQFPLQWRDGRPIEMFTPDFYLPEYDLYIELTTMRQSLVRRKNRKLRLLRALYPEINIKLLYRRDYHRLLQRFGIMPEELDAELEKARQQASDL